MHSLTIIPEELTLRNPMITPWVGLGLFLALVLLSLAKFLQPNVFRTLAIASFKMSGIHSYLQESFPQNKGGALFLLVNYILSFGLTLYVASGFDLISADVSSWKLSLILPIFLLVWPLFSMVTVGFITGTPSVFKEIIELKLLGAELLGLFYFVVVLAISLHPVEQTLYFNLIVWGFVIESALRLFKSTIVILGQGVAWYYIILYFCTLEILPLFVVYYLLMRSFGG